MVTRGSVQTGKKHRAEVLSRVPKCRKMVMCLMENIRVHVKLHSGMSYGAVGREFTVTESIIYVK